MQENKNANQSVLPQKIKIDELTIKKFMGQSVSESLRPMASLKRRKSLKPKAMIPATKKI